MLCGKVPFILDRSPTGRHGGGLRRGGGAVVPLRHDAHGEPLAGVAVARRAADEVEEAAPLEPEPRLAALEPEHRPVRAAALVVVARHHQHRVVLLVPEICKTNSKYLR